MGDIAQTLGARQQIIISSFCLKSTFGHFRKSHTRLSDVRLAPFLSVLTFPSDGRKCPLCDLYGPWLLSALLPKLTVWRAVNVRYQKIFSAASERTRRFEW